MEDQARPGVGTATVVTRTVDGRLELVVVCERCPEVKIIKLDDAMRVALNVFMRDHDEEVHR